MSNSFFCVENINNYTDISATSAEIIELTSSNATLRNVSILEVGKVVATGPIIAYTPSNFTSLQGNANYSINLVNSELAVPTSTNIVTIPVGAIIDTIVVENIGTDVSLDVFTLAFGTGPEALEPTNIGSTLLSDGYVPTQYASALQMNSAGTIIYAVPCWYNPSQTFTLQSTNDATTCATENNNILSVIAQIATSFSEGASFKFYITYKISSLLL